LIEKKQRQDSLTFREKGNTKTTFLNLQEFCAMKGVNPKTEAKYSLSKVKNLSLIEIDHKVRKNRDKILFKQIISNHKSIKNQAKCTEMLLYRGPRKKLLLTLGQSFYPSVGSLSMILKKSRGNLSKLNSEGKMPQNYQNMSDWALVMLMILQTL
jgi:hypothetical protein